MNWIMRNAERFLYETHMHTSEVSGCADCTAVEQVRIYKARGYTGLIITNHFHGSNSYAVRGLSWGQVIGFNASGYYLAKQEGFKLGIDVFCGFEYHTDGSDFLVYGIPYELLLVHHDDGIMPLAQLSSFVRKNGGYIAQAHPYREGSWIPHPFPADPKLYDGIEVFNSTMPAEVNKKAAAFADQHGLVKQSGSDSHSKHIPFASGIRLTKRAESIHDIIGALKTGEAELIVR
jgi:hypothetical protein